MVSWLSCMAVIYTALGYIEVEVCGGGHFNAKDGRVFHFASSSCLRAVLQHVTLLMASL